MRDLGLYIHIPFCGFMCHYCDFNKTSRWDSDLVAHYFKTLLAHTAYGLKRYAEDRHVKTLKSIYFGGGTPSLFGSEYRDLFELFKPFLSGQTEITLEANPKDLTDHNLSLWAELGFNRISVGVQSFSPQGLKFLTRDHTPDMVIQGINRAQQYFSNINIDLIYGWKDQTLCDWSHDLKEVLTLNPQHLSLYNLTFASQTPIGRAQQRGKIHEQDDHLLESYYLQAKSLLKHHNYEHNEVSNWSRPGFASVHNHLYWQDQYYLGVGAGACGYVPNSQSIGLRYAYPKPIKPYCQLSPLDYEIDERNEDSWLTEMITCSLRCKKGIDLKSIQDHIAKTFTPKSTVQKAIEQGLITVDNSRLYLDENEWFRESFWSLEILDCFS